jgi:hypothetical protein
MTQVLASHRSSLRSHPRNDAADRRRPAARHVLKDALRRRNPRVVGARVARRQAPLREHRDPIGASYVHDRAMSTRAARPRRPSAAAGALPPRRLYLATAMTGTHSSRGAERVQVLASLLSGPGACSLEVACVDGMVSYHLAKAGAQATGLASPTHCSMTASGTPAGASFKPTRPTCPSLPRSSTSSARSTPSST